MVHNQQIPASQKMWYLKSSVTGDAAKLIHHFTVSDADYVTAWKVINDRYENSRLLVTAILNKLLSQSSIQNENAFLIRGLHDTTQECILSLESLGITTTSWDSLLLHILLKKLDRNTHTLWEQSLKKPKILPSLKEFLSFLETRFQSLEALGEKEFKHTPEDSQRKNATPLTTAANYLCISCKGGHPLFACQKFLKMQPKERLKLVQKFKHCVNCLKHGHNSKGCSSKSYTLCQEKHNTLLHLKPSNQTNSSVASNIITVPNKPTSSTPSNQTQGAISLASHSQRKK